MSREISLATARGPLTALRSGDPHGPKLLALHGWLDNAASFIPLQGSLSAFDLVALDLPGHGGSAHRLPAVARQVERPQVEGRQRALQRNEAGRVVEPAVQR